MKEEDNLERLVDTLIELGFPKTNMREYIEGCEGLNEIPYFHRRRFGDDEMSYQLTIKKDNASGLYYPQGYEATLLQTHPVRHGSFGAIDTYELEQQMKKITWNKTLQEVAYDPDAVKIYEDMNELLAGNAQAKDIAHRLQLRYWIHTPIEQHLDIYKHISDYQKHGYFPLNNGLADINTREAYHLLSGRAVLKFYQKADGPQRFYTNWNLYDKDKLITLPNYNLVLLLKNAGVKEATQDASGVQLIYDLIRGERPLVHIKKDNSEITVYIEADPRLKSLAVYDKDLNRIEIPGLKKNGPHRHQTITHKKK